MVCDKEHPQDELIEGSVGYWANELKHIAIRITAALDILDSRLKIT